jgi:putative ABC transport system permease protein
MELFAVAFRNVFRNKRRSILNIIAIVVAVFLMVLGLGWVQGYESFLYQAVIDFETGHLQILHADYMEERARLPVDLNVADYTEARRAVAAADTRVAHVTGRIRFSVELGSGRESVRLLGRAIDPDSEAKVTVLDEYIQDGAYLDERSGVLIGAPLAARMGVQVNDTVFLTAVDRHGVRNVSDAPVVGIFDFGYPAIDENVIYTDLTTAMSLLSLEDEVTKLVVRLAPGAAALDALPAVEDAMVTELSGQDLVVRPWTAFAQTTVSAVQADSTSFWMMLVIVYILIVLGILNSMSMSIHERTGEIATLRAIGMHKSRVLWLFLAEGVALAAIGSGIAILLSLPVAAYLGYVGLDVGAALPEDLPIPFGERFRADFRVWHFLVSAGVGSLAAVVGGLFPARRATTVNVAHALQGKK